jgi:NADPH:quinone reductase-like Zn-dependent oxidoreductase
MKVSKSMKAMLLTGHGDPEKPVLENDWSTPDVAADEVLIRVGACGSTRSWRKTRSFPQN